MVDYAFKMLQPTGQEMVYRNVINRAYYGAFLTARDSANITSDSGSVHRDVIEHYQNNNKSIISNNLDDLKRLRQIADYKPQENVSYKQATKSCRTANNILEKLES